MLVRFSDIYIGENMTIKKEEGMTAEKNTDETSTG